MSQIHQIQVSADSWRAYLVAKIIAAAAVKEAVALKKVLGIPETNELV